jgi:O-methyltransferase
MRKEYDKTKAVLYDELWNGIYTLISKSRFSTIDYIAKMIYDNNIKGDIVECGVWRGGMSVYLAYSFLDRVVWVCDSYEGFQNLNDVKYKYSGNERHVPEYDEITKWQWVRGKSIKISLEEVKQVFTNFGLGSDENIKFLKGWVKDTLDPKTCEIKNISVLRVDVDAYSATLEVLVNLYDKVSSGGFIIFDDSALKECQDAIKEFKKIKNIDFILIYPTGKTGNDLDENGGYFKKE